jgi:HEAT repeat protein
MPRIPKEQIPNDMPADIRKHVEGLYDLRDDNVCIASVKALGDMGPAAAPAAPFLASILDRHKSCPTPNAAVDALVRIGKASVEPTILALKVGDRYGRGRAIEVLRQLKDPRAVPAIVRAIADGLVGGSSDVATLIELGGAEYLLGMTADPSPEIRQVAMRVLPSLSTSNAVAALVQGLGDSNEKVRQLAVHGLETMLNRSPPPPIPPGDAILAALKASDAETRRRAIDVVMRLGFTPEQKAKALAPLLTDPDTAVLTRALTSLGSLKTDDTDDLLGRASLNPDPLVRAAVADALASSSSTSAAQVVVSLLSDREGLVREHAVAALASLSGQAEAPRLADMLRSDGDPLVKRRLLQLLGGWRRTEIARDLEGFVRDGDESVRTAAIDAAVAIGTNALDILSMGLRSDSGKVREYAANIAERSMKPSAVTAALLLPLLDSPHEDARVSAARLLARDPSSVTNLDRIARALDDANPNVRASAIGILARRGDSRCSGTARVAAKSMHEGLAVAAVSALVSLRDVAALADAALHYNARVRNAAIEGLASVGTPEAQKALGDLRQRRQPPGRQFALAETVADKSAKSATPEMLVASLTATQGQCPPLLRSRLVALGTNATPLLLVVATNNSPSLRATAIDVLGQTGDRNAAEALRRAVADASAPVRESAVTALGAMGDVNAVGVLSAAMDDEEPSVRERAAHALGGIADPSCIPVLLAHANTEDWHLRGAIVQSLARVKDARSAAALRAALLDSHWHVRGLAAEALGTAGDRDSVPQLIARLGDPHWNVRRLANISLRSITRETLGPAESDWRRWWNDGRPAQSKANDRGTGLPR